MKNTRVPLDLNNGNFLFELTLRDRLSRIGSTYFRITAQTDPKVSLNPNSTEEADIDE